MAQSSMRISALDDPYLTRRLAEVISDLCEGELLQDEQLFKLDVTTESYLERIAKKTASPFELAGEGAARISGADARAVAVARRFGFHLGRLFQLVDDWLDWAGDEADLGKPVGRDLLAGSLTLPVLVALADSDVGPRLRAHLEPFPTEIDDTLRGLVSQDAILAETRALVTEEGERARRWLAEFPAGESKDQLDGMLSALLSQVAAPGAEA